MVRLELAFSAELGLQEIHIACLAGDFAAIPRLLVDNKVIESRTSNGETPLILAALMGNVEAVVILRQHCAALDAVDNFRATALDCTSLNALNDMRRKAYAQAGFFESNGANHRRIAIAAMLNPISAPRRTNTGLASGSCAFRKTTDGVEVYKRIGYINTPGIDLRLKTVGFIATTTEPSPRAWAVSGWSARTVPEFSKLLEGYKWTKAVLHRVAPSIGFIFKSHIQDQGFEDGMLSSSRRGRFFASHTEVKLATWWCFTLLATLKGMARPSRTYLAKNLSDLARAELGHSRHARIEIDQPPCESCARFLLAMTRVTGIHFEPMYRPSLALIPELAKKRNFLLAHQADLTEPRSEDPGSDTDGGWDTDNADDNLIDFEGWQSGEDSESILGGVEEFEVGNLRSSQRASDDQHSSNNSNINSENDCQMEDDSDDSDSLVEEYLDDNIDKSYQGRLTRLSDSDSVDNSIPVNPLQLSQDESDPIFGSVEPEVVLGTPIPSTPTSPLPPRLPPTPVTPFGSADMPIEVPQSPTEAMLLARDSDGPSSKRRRFSKAYYRKLGQAEIRSLSNTSTKIKLENARLPGPPTSPTLRLSTYVKEPGTKDQHAATPVGNVAIPLSVNQLVLTAEPSVINDQISATENRPTDPNTTDSPVAQTPSLRRTVTPTTTFPPSDCGTATRPTTQETRGAIRRYTYSPASAQPSTPDQRPVEEHTESPHSDAYFTLRDTA